MTYLSNLDRDELGNFEKSQIWDQRAGLLPGARLDVFRSHEQQSKGVPREVSQEVNWQGVDSAGRGMQSGQHGRGAHR